MGSGFWLLLLSAFCFGSSAVSSAQSLDRFYDNVKGPPHLEMINNAKSSIDIEIYSMKDTQILKALRAAIARGVRVRIVQEPNPVSDPCDVFSRITPKDDSKCNELKSFAAYVRAHKGVYVPFNKSNCGSQTGFCFQHGKVILTDGNLALISTGNFNPSNLCDLSENPTVCNRDYTVVTRDPGVVRSIGAVFEGDVQGREPDIQGILSSSDARRVTVSPYSLQPLVAFLDSAKETIQVQNQYLKNPDVNNALIRAAKRGVKVFVMVSSACAFGRPDQAAIDFWTQVYTAFDNAGIHSKTFNASIQVGGKPGYLHSKAILVDSRRAWVGSVNGSTTSLTSNREYGIFSDEPQVVHDLGAILYSDYVEKGAESWKESLKCKKDYIKPAPPESN